MTVSATTADGRARVLADGNQMPMLGLGVWQVPNGPATVDAVRCPQQYRRALLDACLRRNVAAEAYSPLGTGRNLSDATVTRVAERAGRTPAQVLLRWCLQRGLPFITKSTHRERIHENAQIFDFTLSELDMAELDALDQTNGTDRALERKWW